MQISHFILLLFAVLTASLTPWFKGQGSGVREGLGTKDKIEGGTPEHVIHRHGVGLLLRQEIYNYGTTVTAWVIKVSMAHSLMVPSQANYIGVGGMVYMFTTDIT